MDNIKKEYETFIRYVKSTWGSLIFEGDFKEEVNIEKVIIHNYKNDVTVGVYINDDAVYYTFVDGELIEKPYDGKAIKTTYYIDSDIMLYMLMECNIKEELGLTDTEVYISYYIDGYLQYNKDLTEKLKAHEESWAESYHCMIHDL